MTYIVDELMIIPMKKVTESGFVLNELAETKTS